MTRRSGAPTADRIRRQPGKVMTARGQAAAKPLEVSYQYLDH